MCKLPYNFLTFKNRLSVSRKELRVVVARHPLDSNHTLHLSLASQQVKHQHPMSREYALNVPCTYNYPYSFSVSRIFLTG